MNTAFIEHIQKEYSSSKLNPNGKISVYSRTTEEYKALNSGVGIRNVSFENIIKLTGSDTLDFIHRVSTNAVKDIDLYSKRNTLFLNEKGRIISPAILFRFDEYFLLRGDEEKDKLYNWLDKYIIMEDITIESVTEKIAAFEITGYQADSYMRLICGECMDSLLGDRVLKITDDGNDFWLCRKEEPGSVNKYLIMTKADKEIELFDYLLSHHSAFDVYPVGEEAYEIFRVEKGIPVYPNELNDNFNPHEALLIEQVDFKKGCYIGQEVIARLDTYEKVQKTLKHIYFEDVPGNPVPCGLVDGDGNNAGDLTSVSKSPETGKFAGLGYVRKKAIESSTGIFTEFDGAKYKLKIDDITGS